MPPRLEILIPLRNPTAVLDRTIQSLVDQTERDFSVALSDNHSDSGNEFIDRAEATLTGGGIAVRRLKPPTPLGRVEHWNWLHYESAATWLKPLFGGDWLEREYMAELFAAQRRHPECAYFYCGYHHHSTRGTVTLLPRTVGQYLDAAAMQDAVLRFAMQFGPPSAAAYTRDAFIHSGGYLPRLPICADALLHCQIAARRGGCGLDRPLINFLIHPARFSDTLGTKARETFRETLCYCGILGLTAWHERWVFPVWGYARLIAREIRNYLRSSSGG